MIVFIDRSNEIAPFIWSIAGKPGSWSSLSQVDDMMSDCTLSLSAQDNPVHRQYSNIKRVGPKISQKIWCTIRRIISIKYLQKPNTTVIILKRCPTARLKWFESVREHLSLIIKSLQSYSIQVLNYHVYILLIWATSQQTAQMVIPKFLTSFKVIHFHELLPLLF